MVGRPRDKQVTSDVLDATIAEIATVGVSRASIDAIADRAGVAKTTVYRRWSTKFDLIVNALRHLDSSFEVELTGDLVDDLRHVVNHAIGRFADRPLGRMRLLVGAEAAVDPSLHEHLVRNGVEEARPRQLMREILERAAAAGELPRGFDIQTAVDQLGGAVIARTLSGSVDFPEYFVEQLVHSALGRPVPPAARAERNV